MRSGITWEKMQYHSSSPRNSHMVISPVSLENRWEKGKGNEADIVDERLKSVHVYRWSQEAGGKNWICFKYEHRGKNIRSCGSLQLSFTEIYHSDGNPQICCTCCQTAALHECEWMRQSIYLTGLGSRHNETETSCSVGYESYGKHWAQTKPSEWLHLFALILCWSSGFTATPKELLTEHVP